MRVERRNRRGCFQWALFRLVPVGIALILLIGFLLFPGPRFSVALTMGTGCRLDQLQGRIDALEDKAIGGEDMSDDDLDFLEDFYRTMARGGRLSWILRQTGQMMDHYLDGTGEPLHVDNRIFLQSQPVLREMETLRGRVMALGASAPPGSPECSRTFNMIDPKGGDAKYGLYLGQICVSLIDGAVLHWRAVVPWVWPSYEEMQAEYGDPHYRRSDIPNLRCVTLAERWRPTVKCERGEALWVDDGLGEYLARVGLAKSFDVVGEWEEEVVGRGQATT